MAVARILVAPTNSKTPVESFTTLDDGTSIRAVRRSAGGIVTTRMGRVNGRRGETRAERAERAFLMSIERPEPGSGHPVRAIDLYSGCGGLSLGVEEACRAVGRAFEPVAAFDRDKDAREVYASNFPGVSTWSRSVAELFDGRLGASLTSSERAIRRRTGEVDFLLAGPPCQGWSGLNNHTRGKDRKNRLYRRVARAAEVLEPRYILIENVVAARDAASPTSTIAHLGELGYRVDQGVVSLRDIGVAQRRRRYVVVGSERRAFDLEEVLTEFERRPRSLRWAIGDLVGLDPGRNFDKPSRISTENELRIAWLRTHKSPDLPDRLRPECHRDYVHTYKSMYGRLDWDLPAQTITSGYSSMGQGRYVHPDARRTLTPHEAARIQFIPDWFTLGDRQRTAWATLIGNAVPLKLSYVIALWLLR